MWVPPEDIDPVVLHQPTRKSIGVFGAVRASDGLLVTSRSEKFNSITFWEFLKKLKRHRRKSKKMLVIVDNAKWHKAKEIRPWLWKQRKFLELDFLPPYSPEINSIERVWKLTRRLRTHNQYFPNLDDLIETVFEQFILWSKPNNTLHKLCAII
jgi:transposase